MNNNEYKILLVDDEPDILEFLSYNLKKEGYNVFTANNGKEAVTVAKKETPHLIILDVMMPDMDGFETIRRIREMEQFTSLPIIALTAKAMKGDREKCMQSGASDYIAKPVDVEQLKSLLRVWLYK